MAIRDPFDPTSTDRIYGGIYGTQAPGILQLASLGAGAQAAGPQPPFDPAAPPGPSTPTPIPPTFTYAPPSLAPLVPPGPAPVAAPATATPTATPRPATPVITNPPVINQPTTQMITPPAAGRQSTYGPGYTPTAVGSQVPQPGGPATPGTATPVTAPIPPSRPAGFGINQPQARAPTMQARPGVVHVQGPDFLKNFFLAGQRSPTGMTAMLNRDRPEGDRGGNR